MLFFIHCIIADSRKSLMPELKESHLAYIGQHLSEIRYGGLVGREGQTPDRICYYLEATSAARAQTFVDSDPYATIFENVEVLPFEQRVP